ncbi:MAG: hypothetical protein SOU19_08395 [Candidatus Caccosoma sp.]|nr:hypothetical protein [Candidatus Caccosoma sp.]
MHNCYFIMLISCLMIQLYSNNITSIKIDSTLSLINEEMVVQSISEKSKLYAYYYDDISKLEIDHQKLNKAIKLVLKENLSFVKYQIKYHYYDMQSKSYCSIGQGCNSVQIKILIMYNNKTYESVVRYEPVKK